MNRKIFKNFDFFFCCSETPPPQKKKPCMWPAVPEIIFVIIPESVQCVLYRHVQKNLEESDPFSLFGTVSRNLQLEGSNVQWGFADICDLVRGNFELGLAFFSLIYQPKEFWGHCMHNVLNSYCNGTTLPASSYWSSCTQLFCWEVIIKFTIENRRTCITLFFLFFLFLSHFNL